MSPKKKACLVFLSDLATGCQKQWGACSLHECTDEFPSAAAGSLLSYTPCSLRSEGDIF